MKLVIQTQCSENYGAHDWDGDGECPSHWKNKGGNTYVVENLTANQINKITQLGIPRLSELLESRTNYFCETILGFGIEEDTATVCDEWEHPIVLSYVKSSDTWRAVRNVNADTSWRAGYTGSTEEWTVASDGHKVGYVKQYHETPRGSK